jgi:hypothetical protein
MDAETEDFYRRSLDDFVRLAISVQRPGYITGLARALRQALAAPPIQSKPHWVRFYVRTRALLARNEPNAQTNDPQDSIAAARLAQFLRENGDLAPQARATA